MEIKRFQTKQKQKMKSWRLVSSRPTLPEILKDLGCREMTPDRKLILSEKSAGRLRNGERSAEATVGGPSARLRGASGFLVLGDQGALHTCCHRAGPRCHLASGLGGAHLLPAPPPLVTSSPPPVTSSCHLPTLQPEWFVNVLWLFALIIPSNFPLQLRFYSEVILQSVCRLL